MDRTTIQNILDAGVRAPSGENSQPWRFVMEDETLSIYNVPERDRSLYNFNQFGSFVAHGALIENIVIAASSSGYEVSVTLFPSEGGKNCMARIEFKKDGSVISDPLQAFILGRMSNRTAYSATPFSETDKGALLAAGQSFQSDGKIVLIEDGEKKRKLAMALSYADRLLFENAKLHDFLFQHIYWTIKDAEAHKSGFYVKELGLAGPQEATFKLLRSSGFLKFFNAIGFPKIAAKGNVKLYANVSALGAIIVRGNGNADFVQGGRIMERVWLTAMKLGYDIQPLTAIIFFMQRIIAGEAQDFSSEQVEGIKKSYAVIQELFKVRDGTVAMLFRIGKGKSLSRQSFRMAPEVEYR